ncbi:MAG: ATP-binding cassette domain-containing protein [Clostridia bacterium]|nr:ATP-binding cassette domain-containing protein [Clostridia bacterium]
MEILRVENLSFKYPNADKLSLDNVSLNIDRGEFVVLCGHSGCGKTTLLRMLKKQLTPFGDKQGKIIYMGEDADTVGDDVTAREIGFVMQDPDSQIVTDKVWHELSFGLENIGVPAPVIRRRIGEISSYFGIEEIFDKNVNELSGGQKQMLNLSSVLAMDPKVLILDEPTSQLDPIAAADFIATLKKINLERSLTVIIAEHRLEDVIGEADKLVVMKNSKIISCGAPEKVCREIEDESISAGFPVPVRLFKEFPIADKCPLNVKDGRKLLEENFKKDLSVITAHKSDKAKKTVLKVKNLSFRYEKNGKDILKDISFDVLENETLCILGGNASGKTTLLKNLASILKSYRGGVKTVDDKFNKKSKKAASCRKIAYLAQNPGDLFVKESVLEDFELVCEKNEEAEIRSLAHTFGIENVLEKHPYDLSYGELQRCAIVKILLTQPDVILLDEPTKGIDAFSKSAVKTVIDDLKRNGKTVVIATHDTEFAAECADRCAFIFSGEIVSIDETEQFFSENIFYTTASSRLSRDVFSRAVTLEKLVDLCKKNYRGKHES